MWLFYGFSFLGIVGLAFTIWMLIYCLQHDPDRYIWMWVIFIFGPVGAGIYFFVRYLPTKSLRSVPFLNRFFRGGELKKLAWKCKQIGNSHQWVEYGEALREVGRWTEAKSAFDEAIKREEDSLVALWGAATVAYELKDLTAARGHLERILRIDPRYKFGDPSLLLGKVLIELRESDPAAGVLKDHVRAHRTPEALYLLGTLQIEAGETDAARDTLQSVIDDLENAPKAIVRKSMFWKSRAKRLLRTLA